MMEPKPSLCHEKFRILFCSIALWCGDGALRIGEQILPVLFLFLPVEYILTVRRTNAKNVQSVLLRVLSARAEGRIPESTTQVRLRSTTGPGKPGEHKRMKTKKP